MSVVQILSILVVPALRSRFLSYGARVDNINNPDQRSPIVHQDNATKANERFLDHLASYTVPHGWFLHFYASSAAMSLLWAYQITNQGYLFMTLAGWADDGNFHMSSKQVIIVWWCLLIQGSRRFVECIQGPTSTSRMWIGHWFIGNGYYVLANIAIWIEGSSVFCRYARVFLNY